MDSEHDYNREGYAKVNGWDDFMKVTTSLRSGTEFSRRIAFRGQRNVSWGLTSSLNRKLPNELSADTVDWLESEARRYFIERIGLYGSQITFTESNLKHERDWWSIMQHYGVPTRLLDWTKSPYVAAYFAVEVDDQDYSVDYELQQLSTEARTGDGVVYYVDYSHLNANGPLFDSSKAIEMDAIEFFEPNFLTDRMVAQQGLFSSTTPLQDHWETIKSTFKVSSKSPGGVMNPTYGKIVIDKWAKMSIATELRSMNVMASTLFPGLDGLGRSIAELLAQHAHWEKTFIGLLKMGVHF